MTVDEERIRVRSLRRTAFAARVALDSDLATWSDGIESHAFLVNPTGQNVYLYLTRYVVDVAEALLDRPIAELRVLDWGSGKGQVSHLLTTRGAHPISCDLRTDAVDSSYGQDVPIIEHAGIDVVCLDDPVQLPFESESMDVVLSFGVLEHVADDQASLSEISRVLVPGGLFICFNLPYRLSWTQRLAHLRGDRYHDRLYGRRQVGSMLDEVGLDVLDMWHRQLLPKNPAHFPRYQDVERADQLMTEYTPFRYLATSLEFLAVKT